MYYDENFLNAVQLVSFIVGIANYQENLTQSDKDDIMKGLDQVIVYGHGRCLGAKQAGLKEAPTVLCTDLSEQERREYRILDNKLNESLWLLDELEKERKVVDLSDFAFDWDEVLDEELKKRDDNPYSKNVKVPHYEITGIEPLDFKKSIKVNNNKYDLKISGRWHTSWQPDCDNDVYSTFMDFYYSGSEIGRGGSFTSVDFESFEELREEINMRLKPFPKFEANEQLSFVL